MSGQAKTGGRTGSGFWKYLGDMTGATVYPSEIGLDNDTYGTITTRRWESWREGVDDRLMIRTLGGTGHNG